MRAIYSRNALIVTTISRSFVAGLAFINNGKHCIKSNSYTQLSAARKGMGRSLSTVLTPEDHMAHVQKCVQLRAEEIMTGLATKGWVTVDNFLGAEVCDTYRSEAVGYYSRNEMTISKSTRWDAETSSVVTYDKHNVFATQLNGGDSYYDGPRLHEYVVSLVKSLVPIISDRFPDACLNPQMASNKLAVCTGDGSYYDKHYDNSGGDDLRKLTVLYYLNPKWRNEMGGAFRIYECAEHSPPGSNSPTTPKSPSSSATKKQIDTDNLSSSIIESSSVVTEGRNSTVTEERRPEERTRSTVTTDISPKGDRLLVFWSDRIVHSVQPSQVGALLLPVSVTFMIPSDRCDRAEDPL